MFKEIIAFYSDPTTQKKRIILTICGGIVFLSAFFWLFAF